MSKFLHDQKDFAELVAVVADSKGIAPTLVEKDYWIMHALWGLKAQGFQFELKGGTSLSKGFGITERFSEDIDIRIEPPHDIEVKTGRNHDKPAHIASRRAYYDTIADRINIPGIDGVNRDHSFDDEKMRSAGIRLFYKHQTQNLFGVKEGILLELGFDDTAPNVPVTISSWAFDFAQRQGLQVKDNRAADIPCYAPTHTFVEKLQTISTKYRRLMKTEQFPANFLRHYYDLYCLLARQEVRDFIKTQAYLERKSQRFRTDDEIIIAKNPAFTLTDTRQKALLKNEYQKSATLYYAGQPDFEEVLQRIREHINDL